LFDGCLFLYVFILVCRLCLDTDVLFFSCFYCFFNCTCLMLPYGVIKNIYKPTSGQCPDVNRRQCLRVVIAVQGGVGRSQNK